MDFNPLHMFIPSSRTTVCIPILQLSQWYRHKNFRAIKIHCLLFFYYDRGVCGSMSSNTSDGAQILPKLFARLSHDSKRNFRQINMFFDLLVKESEFDDGQLELINMINSVAKKGDSDIAGLDRFSTQIDVSNAVCELTFSDVLESVARDFEGLSITGLDAVNFPISFNPHGLKAILEEVLSNSVKFCPEAIAPALNISSTVDAGTRVIKFASPTIGTNTKGIDSLWLPYARDPSMSAIEGHGMGLTIVAYLVSQSGGELQVSCNEDEGFIVAWRLAQEAASGLSKAA